MTLYDQWDEPLNILQYDSKLGWMKFPKIFLLLFKNQTKEVLFKNQTKEVFASLPCCFLYSQSFFATQPMTKMITRSRHRIYKTLSNRYRLSRLKIQRESKPDWKRRQFFLWHLTPTADRSGGSSKEKCSKSDLGNNSAAPQAPATHWDAAAETFNGGGKLWDKKMKNFSHQIKPGPASHRKLWFFTTSYGKEKLKQ